MKWIQVRHLSEPIHHPVSLLSGFIVFAPQNGMMVYEVPVHHYSF
ncbi:hypothetical protein [Gracilimonas sp.]